MLRAKIVLAAAEGKENKVIATDLICTRRTIGTWRTRFVKGRLEILKKDASRSGRKPSVRAVKEAEIIRKMTQETPANATQWSVRTMAKAVGVSKATVQRVWSDNGLQPHRVKSFKVSNDPTFAENSRMSTDCTSIHLSTLWCCPATRRVRFRRWIEPIRAYRCFLSD